MPPSHPLSCFECPFGGARGDEVGAAICDTDTFMDPRSRKDW